MSFNLSICPAEINKYCSLGDVVNGTLVSCNSSLIITIIFKIINIFTITIVITILGQLQLLLTHRHPLGQQLLCGGVQPAAGLRGAQGQDGRGVPGLFVAVFVVFVWQILANTLSETKIQISLLILRRNDLSRFAKPRIPPTANVTRKFCLLRGSLNLAQARRAQVITSLIGLIEHISKSFTNPIRVSLSWA